MSNTDAVRTYLAEYTGPFTVNEIATEVHLTNKQAADVLRRLVKNEEAVKVDDKYQSAKVDYVTDEEISSPAEKTVEEKIEQSFPEPVEAPVQDDEDLIGEVAPEPTPAPEKPAEPVDLKHSESRAFGGNYSIAMVPAAGILAEAFDGVQTRHVNTKTLMRVVYASSDRKADLGRFLKALDALAVDVFPALKAWQKEHIERRRSLTDMQRFLEHRQFIQDFAAARRDEIKSAAS